VVSAVVYLVHGLGSGREGVETAEQAERAGEPECDLAQGFYFAELVTIDEA
jgi:EAL domain-containing protein (putative c-di-GMP-specific phosphodiesterase class I)